MAHLPDGTPTKAETARLLRMTSRTLLRRLKQEGTTFTAIIDQLREELAFQYLQRDNMSIGEASYLLGFSDEGTFSRAFKRWTGRRPSLVARGEKPGGAVIDRTRAEL
jgi:AraC-like DNA-binding protein